MDIIQKREPFFVDSYRAIENGLNRGDRLFISSSAITDIYYIIKKQSKSRNKALDDIKRIAAVFEFAEVNNQCIMSAMDSSINDFEDAVVDEVAQHIKASFIVTRNLDDFDRSKTQVISPSFYYSIK